MDVFIKTLCRESVKLEPKSIGKNFKEDILKRLRARVEGICSKHGYIKKDSVEIHKVAPGAVELISLCGNVVYDVYFHAEVCNPLIGSVVKANITNANRFGILAEAGYHDRTTSMYQSVIEIIIAKNSINIQSEVNLEKLEIGQEIRAEIVGRQFKLGQTKICTLGRVIKEAGVVEEDLKVDEEVNEDEEGVEDDDEVTDGDDTDGSESVESGDDIHDDDDDKEDNQSDEFYMSGAGSVFSASSVESISDGGSVAGSDVGSVLSSAASSYLDD